jgi:hypothetical protein
VDASFSIDRDVIGWRQSKTRGDTIHENVIIWLYAGANHRILVGDDPKSNQTNTDNDSEVKKQTEERKFHRMAKVHDRLKMWQGSQNLCATQKASCAQIKRMASVGYISVTEVIVKAIWLLSHQDGWAAFKLSERSPLPPALSAKNLPGG